MSTTTESRTKKEKSSSKKRKSEAVSDSNAPEKVTESDPQENNDEEPPAKKRKASVEEIEVDITKPEPPSRKAKRLLKKGKPLPPSNSGAETSPEPSAAPKEKKSEAEKRSEHAVWIGNLPWTVSQDELRKFFTEYSDIKDEQITRIHMPGPSESKQTARKLYNKGFAYVDFSTAEGVELAIELSEQLLGGRRVLIKNHKSFEGRPEKKKEEAKQQGRPPNKKVFVGNLSFDATEESIKEHFEKCGPIESVKVAQFEDSGKCKGYAWVTFEELEAAESAVKGYVMIKEDVEESGSESEEADDSNAGEGKKTKPTKTRKWWVNRMKGRSLKLEFAEDAQVRYKKRFGKEGKEDGSNEVAAKRQSKEPKSTAYDTADDPKSYASRFGNIIASEGKKTTF